MKIYLNLLPEEKKDKIRRKKRFELIVKQGFLFLSLVLFLTVILLNVGLIIDIQMGITEKTYDLYQSSSGQQELKRYEDKFRDINSRISLLSSIESNHIYWMNFFSDLNKIIPDGILLSDLTVNGLKVSAAGAANTRENLIKFQDNINKSSCFKEASVPLSDLVIKENVIFQIDFAINGECLKPKQ